jgi:hypothetical protein
MKIPGFKCRCALRLNMFHRCRDLAPKIQAPSPLPANSVCTAFLRTPGFVRLYLTRATLISTLLVEAGSKKPSTPRWHSDPQAAPCRTGARKRVPRLPRRSAARCNPINAVSRLRLPGQSGSSPRTTPSFPDFSFWKKSPMGGSRSRTADPELPSRSANAPAVPYTAFKRLQAGAEHTVKGQWQDPPTGPRRPLTGGPLGGSVWLASNPLTRPLTRVRQPHHRGPHPG